MAEHENITAMDETHNPEPSNLNNKDKGMKSDPTKLTQAIVADRDYLITFGGNYDYHHSATQTHG